MKRNISFYLILIIVISVITGCGQNYNYNTIPAPANHTSSANNLSDTIPDNAYLAKDMFSNITISADQVPYFKKHNIQMAPSLNFTLPFAVFCTNDDFSKIIEVPGVTLEPGTMYYEITDITASNPDKDGYTDVTISVNASYSFLVHEDDSVYDNSFYSYSIHRAEFELADYYTGVHFPNRTFDNVSRATLLPNLEINDKTYAISENAVSVWAYESHNWKILDNNIPLYELPISAVITSTYTVHMPKDYDGLMLYINKNGLTEFTQSDLDAFRNMSINERDVEYVLDNEYAGNILAIRISDYLKNQH